MSDQTTAPSFDDDVQGHMPIRWGAQSEQPEGDDGTDGHRASSADAAEQAEGDDDTEGHARF